MVADFKKVILMSGLILAMFVMPICAEQMGNYDATNSPEPSSKITWFETTVPLETTAYATSEKLNELIEYRKSINYLKTRWAIWNFTHYNNVSYFWIYNEKATDIYLSELTLKNDDTNKTIPYLYSKKITTTNGESTDSLWNLWGLLNPDNKLCPNETLQIMYNGHASNISVNYKGHIISYMEDL